MDPRPLTGGHTSMGAYERHLIKDVHLFLENIDAARCVLLAPPKIPFKEFTRLRKKSETKGDLHPVWGFPWMQLEHTFSVAQAAGSLTLKELQGEAQLEFILIQQDLRDQFAHLVVKRQLITEMEVLRSSTQPSSQRDRGGQQPSGSLPGASLPAPINSVKWDILPTSLAAGAARSAAALRRHAPREREARHSDQERHAKPSLVFEYEARSQSLPPRPPTSGPDRAGSFLQDEIALDIGLGALAATQSDKPTAFDVLRQDVDALGRETRELHGRVNHQVPAFALKELHRSLDALAFWAHIQMPAMSRRDIHTTRLMGIALNGAHTVRPLLTLLVRRMGASLHSLLQALTTLVGVVSETQPRFEEGSSPTLDLLPPSQGKILRTIVPCKTPHEVDDIGSAMPVEDPNRSNEAVLHLVIPNGANQHEDPNRSNEAVLHLVIPNGANQR
ncbi:ATP-binding cassette (ABC) Superfamily [Phytophthora palmivora]|uniref:ATP-binding cassette (ABC) Superfamily n=1 Tax=Phytophthora palmivora TaxID=4796 RepID=A0A2P4Y4L9_9STRA|nr:ATP-binding cassette (ABC) Superfamily [Phytophthora palmivora]